MDKDRCFWCKHYWYDSSTDASDCMKAEELTEEQFEKHFINDETGCPFFEYPQYPEEA